MQMVLCWWWGCFVDDIQKLLGNLPEAMVEYNRKEGSREGLNVFQKSGDNKGKGIVGQIQKEYHRTGLNWCLVTMGVIKRLEGWLHTYQK